MGKRSSKRRSKSSFSSSVPRLPPELIAHIQVLAEEDQSLVERQKLRSTFELVNREWYNLTDHATEVIITKTSDVERLMRRLGESSAEQVLAVKTKSVLVRVQSVQGPWDITKLCELWSNSLRVTRLELGWTKGIPLVEGSPLSKLLVDSLACLTELRHFKLVNDTMTSPRPTTIDVRLVQKLVQSWPELRTFTFSNGYIRVFKDLTTEEGTFTKSANLQKLDLGRYVGWNAFATMVTNLPPSLQALAIHWPDGLMGDEPSVVERLAEGIPPSLAELWLIGTMRMGLGRAVVVLNPLIDELSSVRRLTIEPCAVTNFATALGGLPHLTHLTLVGGYHGSKIDPFEIAALIRQAPSLARLSIDNVLRAEWTKDEQRLVQRVLKNKGVELVSQ